MPTNAQRFEEGMALNDLARRMNLVGIQTNQVARKAHAERLNGAIQAARTRFRECIGDSSFDLPEGDPEAWESEELDDPTVINSANKLKRLFFGRFKVKPTVYSKTSGAPSLDENALKNILSDPSVLPTVKETTRALLVYRENQKTYSTYVVRLDPNAVNKKGKSVSYLFGGSTILHPTWNVLQAKTGRWSCSGPNLQNIQKDDGDRAGMRDMFMAREEDLWIIEGDYKQLEVRIIAGISGCQRMIEVFNRGEDIYGAIAEALFKIQKATTDPKKWKQYRAMAKIFVLASNYGGGIPVIHAQMVLSFPDITPKACEVMQKRFFEEFPEIPAYQKRMFAFAKKNGYVECPISGRRVQFYLDRIKPTEAANFPIQGTAGDIINPATLRLDALLDWANERLVMQIHDALYLETRDVAKGIKRMKDAMEGLLPIGDKKVRFDIDLKVGKNWGAMKDYVEAA